MSSSSSSSSSDQGAGNGSVAGGRGRRRGDFEGPSLARQRVVAEVWPEPFLEALAFQVAIDASTAIDRLGVAQALANVFQVCSTWRAVSRSNPLWRRLTSEIWGRTRLLHNTWLEEYIYWHRTARNFRTRRSRHAILDFDQSDVDNPDGLICRCLTLSDRHLACGFADGAVRLFDLTTRQHVATFRPQHRDRLGRFGRAVAGIVISDPRLVFATLDGDIHVAIIDGGIQTRRAHHGQVVEDGVLVDFAGCGRWWVALYAGAPDRAFHIHDGNTEELVFVGGSLTNPYTVDGWHMLNDLAQVVGRVRVTSQELAVACTRVRAIVFDLRNPEIVIGGRDYRHEIIVTSLDANDEAYIFVDRRGVARARPARTAEDLCRFVVRGAAQRGVMGCINNGYALMCSGEEIRVWDVKNGQHLYRFRERTGEVNAFVADDRHVAAYGVDTRLHLWDFGAE